MRFALIPAGGQSLRMGQPKLALPLGGRPVLAHVIAAFRQAGVEQVLVVVTPRAPELVPIAESAGAAVLVLAADTPSMRETIEVGLTWLEQRFTPQHDHAWLLSPADHPTLEPDVIRQLDQARQAHPQYSIFLPSWEGRRGHPALIAWRHVAGMRQHPREEGFNRYFRLQAQHTLEVTVNSPNILCDLDTPEDYAQLQARWPGL
jgi:CTP:molybdopterin cytidylyltransferase MocA